jgi:uncharacterized membrane protein
MSNPAQNPDITIVPPPGLVKEADPRTGQKTQFALFSDSWLQLQGYVGAAMELPMSKDNFEDKYGSLGSSKTVTDCIQAMSGVQQASVEFGNPKTLRAALIKNPSLLATPQPPQEIYTHTAWMGQRVHETALKIASGYESVLEGLSGLPAKDQVDNLKAYLFDVQLGPIPLSGQMSQDVATLIRKLGKFEEKMHDYNDRLQNYTRGSSAMVAEVNTKIGGLAQQIAQLEKARDDAHKAYINFMIAAITSSVACALIGALLIPFTAGVSALVGGAAAIALSVGLGVKSAACKKEYNAYCDQIATQQVDLRQKQRLSNDLRDFNTQIQVVAPAMSSFLQNLQTVEGVWVQMNTDMVALGNSITESNIGTIPFLIKSKAKYAIDSWKAIDSSAKQFTVESLVDYTSVAFGDKIPENKPQKVAA